MSALVETMMYVGQIPWHGEGKKLDQPPTSKEAIIQAGLDWTIRTDPIYQQIAASTGESIAAPEGGPLVAPPTTGPVYRQVKEGQVVIRESDRKVLGVVGPRWTPVQNADAFNFFDPLVQDGLALYHTAGSLRGGKTVWILAQIGEKRHVIGDDYIGQFLLLSLGHDGTRGVHLMPTPVRVVCANTEGMAQNEAEEEGTIMKFSHTTNVVERLNETREFIRPFLHNFDHTIEVFKVLAQAQVSVGAADEYLRVIFPDPVGTEDKPANTAFAENVRAICLAKFEGDLLGYEAIPAQFQRTYWTLYNAVTEYVDHERGADKHRLNSLWTGSGKQIKDQALELATVGVR